VSREGLNMGQKVKVHLRQIFEDHWSDWWEKHRDRIPSDMQESVAESVEKMLRCGDPKHGYTKYKCATCPEHPERVIGFSCNSRFCPRCGKRYVDEWVEKQVATIVNVSHRHAVFTVPEELRGKIYWHRDLLDRMCDRVAGIFQAWYRGERGKKGKGAAGKQGNEVGVIAVVHTFGRDMKFNPHIHALVTEGALTPSGGWKPVHFIPYAYLRRAWQKLLLDLILARFGEDVKMRNLINQLYHRYKDGFYVHAETRMKDARGAARYIGRYLARPVIAEYRITRYDGKRVDFWYVDHRTHKRVDESLSAEEFISRLVMHIPKKHSRMVHRYGLYRRNKGALSKALGTLLPKRQLTLFTTKHPNRKTWKERATESFGENPVQCSHCGNEMILWEVWHPEKGFLYHVFHEERTPLGRRWGEYAQERVGRRQGSVRGGRTGCVA
jgi:hypothetical protein